MGTIYILKNKINGKCYIGKTERGFHERFCIVCPEHGEFWQLASNHYKEHPCPNCVTQLRSKDKTNG